MNTELQIARDPEGYLIDPIDWDESIAGKLAAEEGIDLTDTHWQMIRFMREYWTEGRIAPDVRHVVDFLARKLNMDKRIARNYVFQLFPYGYVKQACKIAGMQRPRVWSTG
ncbi:MAG: TusE/DsrC/DsvC family sulfur relay protein [Acidiferrobacterales bacterium]